MTVRAAARAASFLAAVVALGGCDGCKATAKGDAAGTDAAPSSSSAAVVIEAGPPAKPIDRTLVAVAEGSSDVKLVRTFDGDIVLVSGSMPFEAKPSGALEPLVTAAGLAPLYPDDDTFVGFLASSTSVQWVRGDLRGPGPLLLDGFDGRDRKTFVVRDGKLAARSTPIDAHHVVRWRGKLLGASFGFKPNELGWIDGSSEPAPAPIAKLTNITALAVDREDTLVALALGSFEKPRAALFPATWKSGDAPILVEGDKFDMCSLVPSFDASVVVRCMASSPAYGDGTKFLKVTKEGFERVFPDAPDSVASASIGKDGALYVALTKKLAVQRCPAPNGKCTDVAVQTEFTPLEPAQYEHDVSDVVERKGEFDMGERSWTTIKVEAAKTKDAVTGSFGVLARGEDDIWVWAKDYRRAVVFHATDDPQRDRARLPSQLDGRFMARNARAPQVWTGHCEQVFVRLRPDDAKRGGEIEKALGAKPLGYESAFHWWAVEGRLHEDKVSGVVIARRDVEEPLDKMERATEKLVEAFTPDPMSRPKVYCTLPVLERVLYPTSP